MGRVQYRRLLSGAWALTALAALGVTASILVALSLQSRERRLFEMEFEHRAEERAAAIERELRDSLTLVESIVGLYQASEFVEPDEFRAFVGSVLQHHPAIQGLGFNPLVTREQRRAHEQAVRRDGHPGYRITERAADGRLVPAGQRDEYVVVALLEPLEGNETALGYDIASEPVRREALVRARDSGKAAITGRLTLVQEAGDQFGALICMPIYSGPQPLTVSQRRQRLRGYAVGVVRFGDLVDQALTGLRPTGIDLSITDELAPEDRLLLHYHRSRTLTQRAGGAAEAGLATEHPLSYGFEIAGRRWRVEAWPTAAFVARWASWAPAGALLAGLLISGMLVGYLAWQTSVSERLKRAVLERERAEERQAGFGRVLDEAHDEIYIFAADSLRFLHVNRGALRNLGYTMAELRTMTPLDLKPRMTVDSFAELLRPLRDESLPKIEFMTVHRRKDGSLYDVEVHLQRSKFDGVPAFVAVILDITERKRLEERMRQSQRLEALGTLAGGTAHDVNNLLTAIMGYTELSLVEVPPESPVHRNLSEVIKASERARDVVRQILMFSRRNPIERRPVDLRDIAAETVRLMRAALPPTIAIQQDLSDACTIQGDPSQIHQVMMNLFTNAAHAMRGRDGLLEVRVETVELSAREAARLGDLGPGSYARIVVRDNGHGIPPEIRARIFDPFFTTKDQGEGTGMGLSVAHGIVRGHGGTLNVISEVDRGSTFEIYLPRIEAHGFELPETEVAAEAHGERILLVDDEPAVVDVLTEMLGRSGYRVEAHNNGTEALETVRAQPDGFDLVITDYSMPNMTGTTLAREVGRLAPDLPVILVSGYGDLVDEREIRESGVRELLTKPLRRVELTETIRRALDGLDEPAREPHPGQRRP